MVEVASFPRVDLLAHYVGTLYDYDQYESFMSDTNVIVVGNRRPAVRMRVRVKSVFALAVMVVFSAAIGAQQPAPSDADLAQPNFLPIGPPADLKASRVPDLSGDWSVAGIGQSLSAADPGGRMRGKEPDIPYKPWALASTLAQVPPTGPDANFERNTDPAIHYCEPLGLGRIYMYPGKTRFIQTTEAVYMLHEIGPVYRVIWLNAKHPEDPDPQYWGHSIGWYENDDTLVIDTVGVNDRSWLDQLGHPRTEKFHFIERYRKMADGTLVLDMTVDDPGAYTKPWPGKRNFRKSETGFLRYQWVCSVRDNNAHYEKVGKSGNTGSTTFQK